MTRMEKRKTIEEKKKNKRIKWILGMVFIASTILFYFFGPCFFSNIPGGEEENEFNLIFDNHWHRVDFLIEEEIVFLPIEWIEEHIVEEIEVLQNPLRARVFFEKESLVFQEKNLKEFMGSGKISIDVSLLEKAGEPYFPLSEMDAVFHTNTLYYPKTEKVMIDLMKTPYYQGTAFEEENLRDGTDLWSRRKAVVKEGEEIRILETTEEHYYVWTEKGQTGFLPKSSLIEIRKQLPNDEELVMEFIKPEPLNKPFGMVWEYVGNSHPDRSQDEKIPGLSVVSPTWFDLENENGDVTGRAQFRYASYMRKRGYHIWGLVTNSFDPDMTEAFLMNQEAQDHFIQQLLIYSSLYKMEGINIDFENIHYRNQQPFTEFVQRLSEKLREQGLVVSIDVTIPGGSLNWSQVYDREQIAPLVDYVCVMTYDEHWGSSPVAGSVASIGWVENGIKNTLKEVPAEKVVLGLPFYTRLWEESKKSDGSIDVSSRALGMEYAKSILEEHHIYEKDWKWIEETGQFYAEYESEGNRYRIWLEEERSIAKKAALIEKYELAGFAGWRKGFEISSIWDVLKEAI
ncbi:Glycosyl hydrolases family 18 [Tindallia californiensis]|uniref:Glycosyl hydrolases family 18 n=2 Tax=Tindallia californiensis TaxID=159292 RepID=A0A1H3MX20_9FIRM|nr:Glycosyl hydrolases family 18 [Tindallia californiensis]